VSKREFDTPTRILTVGEFGSLYPALKRLEAKGWISAKWEISEHNRRAKFYRPTAEGRKQLHREHSKWADFV
jgi:DNA-binding PadR family transcriptional regulator